MRLPDKQHGARDLITLLKDDANDPNTGVDHLQKRGRIGRVFTDMAVFDLRMAVLPGQSIDAAKARIESIDLDAARRNDFPRTAVRESVYHRFNERVDLERMLRVTNATALFIADRSGTEEL